MQSLPATDLAFLATYLVNAAWQIPVVALCALAVSRFAGLSPRGRNRLWLGFLAAAAILPAIALPDLLPQATPTVARVPADAVLAAPTPVEAAAAPLASERALSLGPWAVWAMTAAFVLIAFALAARLVVAAAAARRLVRDSQPVALPAEVRQSLERLAQAHDRRAPPVRRSDRVSSPAVVGALRPVILIPPGLQTDMPGQDLRAALLHEMAHVIRHDYAVNLVCEVLTLPVCWHPALLGLKAGVRRSRELACDAMAAAAMASPKAYAKCLVSLAQSLGAQSLGGQTQTQPHTAPAQVAMAVGLFGRSDLEDRLMQLMKPQDAEGRVIRAARLCGLAAVGASLLGSAALLHVTPVFAQPAAQSAAKAAAPVTSRALPAPAAAAAGQAVRDAGPEPRTHRRHGLIWSKDGVLIQTGETGYRHSFTGSDGKQITVYSDDQAEPTAEQQRQWEQAAREGEAKAAAAEAMINSPEFKARIADAERRGREAEAMVNSPEFKARIAKAEAQARDAEKMVNSPEFKARIAKAEAQVREAEKMVNSPEFKARIAKAEAQAREAEKMVNSPEFKERIARAQAEATAAHERVRVSLERAQAQIQRELDELPSPRAIP